MDRRVVRVIAAATFFFAVAVGAILSILPVYMVEVLGATALVVGVVEGLGSAVEAVTLVFSGALSDRLGRRKPLAVAGYGLYLLIKPVFILAGQLWIVAAARVADRFSIAVFAAPQQALIGDVSAAGGRGAAFGLRAAADGLGAMTGPVLATVALGALGLGYEAVFWIALAAAAMAFAVFTLGVREDRGAAIEGAAEDVAEGPAEDAAKGPAPAPVRWRAVLSLGPTCNWVLVVAAGIWMAHVSEAFAILKALDIGLDKSRIPLVFMTMAGSQAVAAYPAGRLSDRWGRARLLAAGVLALALAHGILAFAESAPFVFAAAVLWGGHGGLSVGLLAAMVADAAPPGLRGTAFGVYHLVAGMAALAAMATAGAVWDAFGPTAMFAAWAALSIAVLAGVLMARRWGGLPP